MKKITNPRQLAVVTLNQLEDTEDFLREVLDFHIREHALSPLDQGLYTELVYGTTRMRLNLDYVLAEFSSRPLSKIKGLILNNLRVALYQILYLDRVPVSAAVNEGVKLARLFGHQGVAGFTNGLLRSVLRSGPSVAYPALEKQPIQHISLKYSFPEWIVELWVQSLGVEETMALCAAMNEPPRLNLRVNTLRTTSEHVASYLREKGASVTPGRYVPEIIEARPAQLVINDPYLAQGMYYIQDESSALVAHALQVESGQRVYDLCSAPGGKATHLAQLMENEGQIVAFDQNPARLKLVDDNARRLGITIITTKVGDATTNLALPIAERILVDAPCSGLGTMAHRPDIRWRKSLAEIEGLAAIQLKILRQGATYLAPGGLLVYSTCTLTEQENGDVARAFLAEHPNFQGGSLPEWFPSLKDEPNWCRTIYPHCHGLDGFFIAVFRKD